VAFILIIFIVAGSIGAVVILSRKNPSLPLKAQTTQIVNGTANVDADSYVDYQFIVPVNSSDIHVSGTFTVQGGSSDSIMVYIFDSTNFDNYETGAYFGALYETGQVTTSLISSNLDTSGNYYLVLDNTLSTTPKTVNIQANVTYLIP